MIAGPREPGPVLVEGGHYTLHLQGDGEPVEVPGLGSWQAGTSDTTRQCFQIAADEVVQLRERGVEARLGLLVGDLALSGTRPPGGAWALPRSYRAILETAGLHVADVIVYGEAHARNRGKRRLLDEARHRFGSVEDTYGRSGWALFREGESLVLASDASLEWEGDVRAAVLSKGRAPLCPLVFAGLKSAIFQAGFRRHLAIYALADDPWIDVKLRAAATTVAQLYRGAVGEQVHRILRFSPSEETFDAAELVGPGELPWPQFLAALHVWHPDAVPLGEAGAATTNTRTQEDPCPATPPRSQTKKPGSPSSG